MERVRQGAADDCQSQPALGGADEMGRRATGLTCDGQGQQNGPVELREQLHPQQVFFIPLCLKLNHGLQGLGRKGVTRMVERNRDAPPIRVAIALMAPGLGVQREPVPDESGDEFPRRERAQPAVVDRNALRSHDHMELQRYLHFVRGRLGDGFAVFAKLCYHHLHHLVDMAVGFLFGVTPSGCSLRLQRRTVCVPAIAVRLYHDLEVIGLHRLDPFTNTKGLPRTWVWRPGPTGEITVGCGHGVAARWCCCGSTRRRKQT